MHRAHAVVDLGDGGRRGDVHHRRAQPVGRARRSSRARSAARDRPAAAAAAPSCAAPAGGQRQRRARAQRRRASRRRGDGSSVRRCQRGVLLCRGRAPAPPAAARPIRRVRAPAGASHAFVPSRRRDGSHARASQTRATPAVTASSPSSRRRSGSMPRDRLQRLAQLRRRQRQHQPLDDRHQAEAEQQVVNQSSPALRALRRRARRRPPARRGGRRRRAVRRAQVVEEGAVGLDHQRGVLAGQRRRGRRPSSAGRRRTPGRRR